MSRASLSVAVLLLANCADVQACGRGWRGRPARCRPACYYSGPVTSIYPSHQGYPTYQPPAVAYAPAPYQAPSAAAAPAPSAPGVQPQYSYEAVASGGAPAYYYSYDDSGKLIIKQWGDWLLRGGIVSGMPMPPLPIIGRLRR